MTSSPDSLHAFLSQHGKLVVRHDAERVAAARRAANRATTIALSVGAAFLVVFVAWSVIWGGPWWIIGASLALLLALWVLKPRSYASTLRASASGPDGLAISIDASGVGVAEAPSIPWEQVSTVMLLDERQRFEEDSRLFRVHGSNLATVLTRALIGRLDRYADTQTGQAYLSVYVVANDPSGTVRGAIPEALRHRVFARGETLQFIVPLWTSVGDEQRARVIEALRVALHDRGEQLTVLGSKVQLVRWAAEQTRLHGDTRNVALL